MNEEFYIGYKSRGPSGLARHTRVAVLAVGLLTALATALTAARQTPADSGTFEYGITRTFEGVLHEMPLPMLRTVSPAGGVTNYLLVGAGKHGLPACARGHDGERVRFQGSLIRRRRAVMIELNRPSSFEALGRRPVGETEARPRVIGEAVLSGELVDTKCWHGVMRPATGKVHRACAVRCLSGGVPPGLLVRDGGGNGTVVLLTSDTGAPLKFDPQWAARIVTADGTLEYRDEIPILRVRRLALAPSPR
ncbi:MAG: hypothetical protein KF791_18480 [Verrucomicrobiae bacterium]|nr:hypothetical protein [Verrucomicrobiae bacterium]